MFLPRAMTDVRIPPVKIQGIKSKLVPFIARSVSWNGKGTYFEPFMGSGVVGFNLAPENAVFSDLNPHLIAFYRAVQAGEVTAASVRAHLDREGALLASTPADRRSHFYAVRRRFNATHDPHDFLFLQRANFNGMMRFNSKGEYNVPFCRKPERFSRALVTKIANQVEWTSQLFRSRPDWVFEVRDFSDQMARAGSGDFVYLDPPYIDRHDEYFSAWSEGRAIELAEAAQAGSAGYALSMWKANKYRVNEHLEAWKSGVELTTEHFYHVGGRIAHRNAMVEALVVAPDCVADRFTSTADMDRSTVGSTQGELF